MIKLNLKITMMPKHHYMHKWELYDKDFLVHEDVAYTSFGAKLSAKRYARRYYNAVRRNKLEDKVIFDGPIKAGRIFK